MTQAAIEINAGASKILLGIKVINLLIILPISFDQ
jgi:hypothetical protein